jgi:hypothetical protein
VISTLKTVSELVLSWNTSTIASVEEATVSWRRLRRPEFQMQNGTSVSTISGTTTGSMQGMQCLKLSRRVVLAMAVHGQSMMILLVRGMMGEERAQELLRVRQTRTMIAIRRLDLKSTIKVSMIASAPPIWKTGPPSSISHGQAAKKPKWTLLSAKVCFSSFSFPLMSLN